MKATDIIEFDIPLTVKNHKVVIDEEAIDKNIGYNLIEHTYHKILKLIFDYTFAEIDWTKFKGYKYIDKEHWSIKGSCYVIIDDTGRYVY